MLKIKEISVSLGLTRSIIVCHITDLHLHHLDEKSEKKYPYEASRGSVFPNSSDAEKELNVYIKQNRPDLLLLTGDIIDFPTKANLNALDHMIKTADCRYLYVPGNHDWTFFQGYKSDDQAKKYLPLFRRWTNGSTDFQAFEFKGVMWIGIDNSRYDSVTEEQVCNLENILAVCSKKKIPAVVCLHVPIMSKALEPEAKSVWSIPTMMGDSRADTTTRRFCEIVSREAAAVIAGHIHFWHNAMLDNSNCRQYVTALAAEGNLCVFRFF